MVVSEFRTNYTEWYPLRTSTLICFVDMYWMAPELLRKVGGQVSGTPKGDVYSFAIILWEIMYNFKSGPYQDINLEPKG